MEDSQSRIWGGSLGTHGLYNTLRHSWRTRPKYSIACRYFPDFPAVGQSEHHTDSSHCPISYPGSRTGYAEARSPHYSFLSRAPHTSSWLHWRSTFLLSRTSRSKGRCWTSWRNFYWNETCSKLWYIYLFNFQDNGWLLPTVRCHGSEPSAYAHSSKRYSQRLHFVFQCWSFPSKSPCPLPVHLLSR